MVAADRSPSVSDAVIAYACLNCAWSVSTVVNTDKLIAARIKSADILIYMEYCIVVSALAVFCLMIYSAAFDLYFSDREVSLKVGSVILCVP